MYGEHSQPESLQFDDLKASFIGSKWREVRVTRKGNRIFTGDDFDYHMGLAMQYESVYTTDSFYHTWIDVVVAPDGRVLDFYEESELYAW
jgi:hypothetical protein